MPVVPVKSPAADRRQVEGADHQDLLTGTKRFNELMRSMRDHTVLTNHLQTVHGGCWGWSTRRFIEVPAPGGIWPDGDRLQLKAILDSMVAWVTATKKNQLIVSQITL